MKFVYEIEDWDELEKRGGCKLLPSNFKVLKNGSKTFLSVDLPESANNEIGSYFVGRELARFNFITGLNLKHRFAYEELNGEKRCRSNANLDALLISNIPEGLQKQVWTSDLSLQLELWRIANFTDLPIQAQINLLYQIVELHYSEESDFPEYLNSDEAPDPITECKFLRHMVSHQGRVKNKQLKAYFKYLGLPQVFFDPTDVQYHQLLRGKVPLLKGVASSVIKRSLTTLDN